MPHWRLLRTYWPDRELNLALEWALLKLVGQSACPSTIRIWTNPSCVVIDRSRRSLAEVRLEACRKLGIPILRRPTAGGAVYHDEGNLNWTVVAKRKGARKFLRPSDLEGAAARAIINVLASYGLGGQHKPSEGVFVGSLKLSGMAMYLARDAIMVHGTLLVSANLSSLREVLYCKYEVANLLDLLGSGAELGKLEARLASSLARAFGVELVEGGPRLIELSLASALKGEVRAGPNANKAWGHMGRGGGA